MNDQMILMPRFRGSAIQQDDGWSWEMLVTFMGDGDEGNVFGSKKTFKTKKEAIIDLKKAIQDAIKVVKVSIGDAISDENYIDMNTNKIRRWDKKDEN